MRELKLEEVKDLSCNGGLDTGPRVFGGFALGFAFGPAAGLAWLLQDKS